MALSGNRPTHLLTSHWRTGELFLELLGDFVAQQLQKIFLPSRRESLNFAIKIVVLREATPEERKNRHIH